MARQVQLDLNAKLPNIKGQKRLEKIWNELAQRTAKNVAAGIKRDFEKTVATWETDVKFRVRRRKTNDGFSFYAVTDNKIYGYVNWGTRPHVIKPKNAKMLRFQPDYTAKTKAGTLKSSGGGSSGDFVYAKKVKHPGTKARRFDLLVQIQARKRLGKEKNRMLRDFRKRTTRP